MSDQQLVVEPGEVDAVKASLREMQATHQAWIDHLAPDGVEIACVHCPPNVRELVGGIDHHREVVAAYDRALALIEALTQGTGCA